MKANVKGKPIELLKLDLEFLTNKPN